MYIAVAMSPNPTARQMTNECLTTLFQTQERYAGSKKAPSFEGAGGGGYSLSSELIFSKRLSRKSSSIWTPVFFKASSARFISASDRVVPMMRFLSGSSLLSKYALICFQRLSGMLVLDNQPYALASDTPRATARSFLVIPSRDNHVLSC